MPPITQTKSNKMKKLFAMVVLLLSTLGLGAQSLGIKGGLGYSTLNGGQMSGADIKGRGTYYAGAFVEFPITFFLTLQPEVIYSEQGAKWEATYLGQKASLQLKTSYINIPAMAKLKLGLLSVMAGPQLGFLVGTPTQEISVGNSSVKLNKDTFAAIDFGIAAGVELLLIKGVFIDLRYTHGLINTLDRNNSSLKQLQISNKNNFKNAMLTLGVGPKI